ncbi:MAG: endo-1,4-beta-xylanase [Rhodospirillales bacterium]|nr:endo-1,4-beta-xylanase [Rhodospirillales bacterium]
MTGPRQPEHAKVTRRQVLAAGAAAATWLVSGGPAGAGACTGVCTTEADAGTLRAAACRRGRAFGSGVATGELANPEYADLVARQCAVVVPTWEMKWGQVHKAPDVFDFGSCDRLVAFARVNGLGVRGHTLVWHRNHPEWLPARLAGGGWRDILASHVATLCGRYRHAVCSWDVVNEAVEPEDGRSDGLRDSFWLKAAGFGYLRTAYELAAEYAPEAELVYNDYGCEGDARWNHRRRSAVLHLLERLKKAGVRVDALGMQSHLRVGDAFSTRSLGRFLADLADLGVKPIVTELEVRGDRIRGVHDKDRAVAALYRDYLETVLTRSNCDSVVTWGLSDRHSWRLDEDPTDRPLPFDSTLRAKPAYEALLAVFGK